MGVNDNEGCLDECGVLTLIASTLAPTQGGRRDYKSLTQSFPDRCVNA